MKVSASKAPVNRLVRLVLVAAAISAIFLLLTTACAQGETIDGAVAPLTSAAEDVVEQAPAPTPPVEALAETPEPEGAIDAVGTVVETAGTAVESNATAPSPVRAASETVRDATGATSETARKATGAVSNVINSAKTGLGTTVVTATGDRASKLVGEVGQVAAKTVASVDDQAQQLSGLSEEAGATVAGAAGFGNPPRTEGLLQPTGAPSSGVLSSPGESPVSESPVFRENALNTHGAGAAQPVGVLPRVHVGGVGSSSRYRGFPGAGSWLGALESLDGVQSTPMSRTTGAGSNDPAPLDGPAPAPGSSAAAAGSTGSFFVPLAALLALLALVAPATLRRLGEVPASRPPVPFVCALERPG